MATDISLTLSVPLESLAKRLTSMVDADRVGNALWAEANIEMTEAKKRTPVWNPDRPLPKGHTPGSLRASGIVLLPEWEENVTIVRMQFGGPAAPYAVYVHEDLEAFHKTGQAKFLESVLLESVPYMAARVAARLGLDGSDPAPPAGEGGPTPDDTSGGTPSPNSPPPQHAKSLRGAKGPEHGWIILPSATKGHNVIMPRG